MSCLSLSIYHKNHNHLLICLCTVWYHTAVQQLKGGGGMNQNIAWNTKKYCSTTHKLKFCKCVCFLRAVFRKVGADGSKGVENKRRL